MTTQHIETHRFRNDTQTRKRLMVPESFQHPAKGQLGMWALMVERYSQPGDLVLDPMAGSGATLLAALMGRNVIVNELEHHFILPMVRSWEKMRQNPMLGEATGDVQFLWGDARNLNAARPWPYQELAVRFPKAPDLMVLKAIRRKYRLPLVTGCLPLPDASVGAAITSPPFQDVTQSTDSDFLDKLEVRRNGSRFQGGNRSGYTRPVDAIVTSPSYEASIHPTTISEEHWANPQRVGASVNSQARLVDGYARDATNIGNLRGGDLYALLVYNRLRREPNQPVEVHLCGKCLPAEIAESLLAGGKLDVLGVDENQWRKKPESVSTSERNISVLTAGQKSAVELNDAGLVLQPHLAEGAITNGKAEVANGEGLLGIDSAKRCVNETTSPVQNVGLREALLSIISKTQSKLEDNGITASETWLLSAKAVTPEATQSIGCILCNASLAASPSSQGTQTPSAVLRLRFVIPSIAPLSALAHGQKGNYWLSMLQVYEECFRVLRPNGVMALVLKGFTRDGKYVDLPGQTEALLLEAGWQKHDEWRRELWSLSFWRVLQKRRDPAAWDDRLMYEEVLAFKKPGGEGNGVDAVITSPPYEGSLILEQNGIDEAKLKQPYGPNSQFTRPQNYTRKERP